MLCFVLAFVLFPLFFVVSLLLSMSPRLVLCSEKQTWSSPPRPQPPRLPPRSARASVVLVPVPCPLSAFLVLALPSRPRRLAPSNGALRRRTKPQERQLPGGGACSKGGTRPKAARAGCWMAISAPPKWLHRTSHPGVLLPRRLQATTDGRGLGGAHGATFFDHARHRQLRRSRGTAGRPQLGGRL